MYKCIHYIFLYLKNIYSYERKKPKQETKVNVYVKT